MQDGHVAAADQLAVGADMPRARHKGQDGWPDNQEQDDIDEADDGAGDDDRGLRRLFVGHREEADQQVRQTDQTDDHAKAQGDRRQGIELHAAGLQQMRFGWSDRGIEPRQPMRLDETNHGQGGNRADQQTGLDDLHPGRGQHTADSDIDGHEGADDAHGRKKRHVEQRGNERPGADHLGQQVEERNDNRRQAGKQP